MTPLALSHYTVTTALGAGRKANWQALASARSGLARCDFFDTQSPATRQLQTWIGRVAGLEDVTLPPGLKRFTCRNHALSWLALQQDGFLEAAQAVVKRYGKSRVGIFLGTSTSGIHQTELAYLARATEQDALPDWFDYATTHNVYATTEFVRCLLGTTGPAMTISTACSSSAKVVASAARALAQGYCDAAIVGGTDSLCLTTLYGFNSLQLLSTQRCRPSDIARDGISIGEASGFAILERGDIDSRYAVFGYGESSDAYHMSQPHPEGEGARLAMHAALARAGIDSSQIDYINLHGTGTRANDHAEGQAVSRLFSHAVPCSSTKGWTGHTLGAAGIVEVVFSLLALEHQQLFQSLNTTEVDPQIPIAIARHNEQKTLRYILSNSFGFGGNNCSLILGQRGDN